MRGLTASVAPALLLLCLLSSTPTGLSKVHEVLWDIPADGLQLPSISTVKCGDTIRFRCPANAKHGVFKLETTNWNGTCPSSFELPMIGEELSPPSKACDFSLTLTEGPDFFLTSQIPGACQKNLKVYVHAVCIRSDNTFASNMLNTLADLPSLARAALSPALPAAPASTGSSSSLAGVSARNSLTSLPSSSQPTLGASPMQRPHGLRPGQDAASAGVLEQAKASSAAGVRPVLMSLASAALGAAAFAVVL